MAELVGDLQAQLVKLNSARANGVRQIQYSSNGVSRLVEYRSDAEMAMAQNDLMRRISILLGNTGRAVLVRTSKGLGHDDDR